MIDYENLPHFPLVESILAPIQQRIQTNDSHFFRIQISWMLCQLASMQRATIDTPDRGHIPINMYAINLAPSGFGKGYSTNILEREVVNEFKTEFVDTTFPASAEINLINVANLVALRKGTDPDKERDRVIRTFEDLGPLLYSFDSGTTPAVKQMRQKLLMAGLGSANLVVDEIGSNILGNTEVLNVFLELFDSGTTKQKLVKNTRDNVRLEDVPGWTPTNLLLFGTPNKLLDGGRIEEEFFSFLETGYARRSFFGYSKKAASAKTAETSEELFNKMLQVRNNGTLSQIAAELATLADAAYSNTSIPMEKEQCIALLEYRLHCERLAHELPEFEELRKAELSQRHFKVLKLAGAYAFVSKASKVEDEHIFAAIRLAEDSGKEFYNLLNRERPYARLAKYVAECNRPLTHADLIEDLPYYKGSAHSRNEMLQLATAYGYQNHILIKREMTNGVEFISGEALKETDLNKLIVSYSRHVANDYIPDYAKWDKIHLMTQAEGINWCNHRFEGNTRSIEKAINGFNLVVLDVDNGVSMDTASALLKDYTHHIYTTKSHQVDGCGDRFRIILPINYELNLSGTDFTQFMENIYEWIPFDVDTSAKDPSRKWASRKGTYLYNEGKLIDALPFIPNTSKNAEYVSQFQNYGSLSSLEKWFVSHSQNGNRNNMLFRYGLALKDLGHGYEETRHKIQELNAKLPQALEIDEVNATIMKSLSNRFKQ